MGLLIDGDEALEEEEEYNQAETEYESGHIDPWDENYYSGGWYQALQPTKTHVVIEEMPCNADNLAETHCYYLFNLPPEVTPSISGVKKGKRCKAIVEIF
jgi:hypothetical protein